MRPSVFVSAGLALGLVAGYGLGVSRDAPDSPDPELARVLDRVEELEGELERARRTASAKPRARSEPATDVADADAGAIPATQEPTAEDADEADASTEAELGPGARSAEVARLQARVPVLLDRRDGAALVDTLKALAALAPEGRDAAMELAVRINEDVSGPGELELSQFTFYTSLGDEAVRELMVWSLEHQGDSLDDFRTIAAWSLPWVQPPDRTIELYAEALRTEGSPDVQRGMVHNLAGMKQDAADAVLRSLLSDPTRDGTLRAQVATRLATTEDEAVLAVLEQAAYSDSDPQVREAARAALVARDPPATGFLVTGVLPDGQATATGVRAGDVVVSYDGTPTADQQALQQATSRADASRPVEMVVVRDGEEVTLRLNAGRLGVYGRAVERRTER